MPKMKTNLAPRNDLKLLVLERLKESMLLKVTS
jgi:hypothetical protein